MEDTLGACMDLSLAAGKLCSSSVVSQTPVVWGLESQGSCYIIRAFSLSSHNTVFFIVLPFFVTVPGVNIWPLSHLTKSRAAAMSLPPFTMCTQATSAANLYKSSPSHLRYVIEEESFAFETCLTLSKLYSWSNKRDPSQIPLPLDSFLNSHSYITLTLPSVLLPL